MNLSEFLSYPNNILLGTILFLAHPTQTTFNDIFWASTSYHNKGMYFIDRN